MQGSKLIPWVVSDMGRYVKLIVEGFVPLKERSERLKDKNFQMLGNHRLYEHILSTLCAVPSIDRVSVFTSSIRFSDELEQSHRKVNFIDRPRYLDLDSTSITDVIFEFCSISKAEIIVLAHATSPFLSSKTISLCVDAVARGEHDSALAVLKLKKFVWFNGKPINYDLEEPIPRTQDLPDLFVEQSGLYVFNREKFINTKRRIGLNPLHCIVDESEGIDIDDHFDLTLARQIISSKN